MPLPAAHSAPSSRTRIRTSKGNLSNAYVSGMHEALSMYGNEYTYVQTMYTIAYAIMQIPSTSIIQRVRPSIWLAAMEICWGAFTFAQVGPKSVPELYAFRFLVGSFESSFFPSLFYLLGSWCTKTELAKRVALVHMTAPLGTAFGGYLQAAVYENLDGSHGVEGWRWLYIVCGCMTVPVGIATFFILPDTPYNTRVWFLDEKERDLARERVMRAGKAPPVKITLGTIKEILGAGNSMRLWWFLIQSKLYGSSCGGNGYFTIWLKAENFSVLNAIKFAFVLIPLMCGLLPNGILAFRPTSLALKEFAFLTIGVQLMTAIFYPWANEVCADNNEQRAVVVSSMNGFLYAVAAWLPIVIFPQTMAPSFCYGFPATFGLVIAAIVSAIVIRLFIWRDERRAKQIAAGGEEPVV
ncbi:major facilitator superfamily domain-containing protein [Aspergillus falconensis]